MKYLEALQQYFDKNGFYHFTDTRNIPGIKAANGILSRREATRLKQKIEAVGGNDWSVEADDRTGMDAYVHLCFTNEHPMEFLARQDGRIQSSKFLSISADVTCH
ncbi:MAG: DarT ssDNA thymidine ADP-ribosyltransferase family protein [Pseudolabrys sp.]